MINNVYSIKDTKIGFMAPFTMQNDAVAVRAFANSARSTQPNSVNTNSDDIELWKLGSFDDQTGVLVGDIVYIAKANDYIVKGE